MKGKAVVLKVLCVFISMLMLFTVFTGCTGGGKEKDSTGTASDTGSQDGTKETVAEEPLMEYSYYIASDAPPTFLDNPNDVITPIVKEKFNINVGKVMYNQGQSFKERLNLFIAADNLPDVIFAVQNDATLTASSGRYAETGELIKQYMPNLLKYCPESNWVDALYQGRMYSIPSPFINVAGDEYKDDVYAIPMQNWSWFTRESVLKKLGYSFKPLKQIQQEVNDTGRRPTAEDFVVEPAIATPDDFYNFLKKVKDLNLKVGDKDIIPYTTNHALQIHLGAMFGVSNAWQFSESTGNVTGWLGCDNAKEYYQFLNKLYNEGLLDKDFSIQQTDQIQEKIASGRAAAYMWIPDIPKARASLKQLDPEDEIRPMFLPRKEGIQFSGIDHMSSTTFQTFINKDFKDIPRLMKYFDWFLSDEALDLNTWGPESLGLWEIKDGKKVFKDNALYESLSKGESEKGTLAFDQYKNLGLDGNNTAFKCAISLNGYKPADWVKSYPFTMTEDLIFTYANAFATNPNIDFKGLLTQGTDDVTNAASGWWWSVFTQAKSPKLFAAKTDAEFEKNWDELYKEFLEKGNYEAAQKDMEVVFKSRGFGR